MLVWPAVPLRSSAAAGERQEGNRMITRMDGTTMDPRAEALVGLVPTVDGPIAADELGVTLAHEHLMAVHQGPLVDTTDRETAYEEMRTAVRYGVRTVVDMTNVGLGRDPVAIRDVASRASAQVVMGTGFYKDGWLPGWVHSLTVGEMAAIMIEELLVGVGEPAIPCGVIGEVGVSRTITSTEERSLAASARAQRATGAAINIHFDIGTQPDEYHHAVDILEGEGADLARVVIDHFICRPDELGIARELIGRGPLVEFDLWGQETWPKILNLTDTPPEVQVASLTWFIAAGLRDRILISHDVANIVTQRRHGGFGQAHIVRTLLPQFREYGVTDEDLRVLLVENPGRLFPFRAALA
jgi:phosphotriesterase-related protein